MPKVTKKETVKGKRKPSTLAKKFRVDRNQAREQLKKSAEKNTRGGFYFNLPDGMEFFKPKKGKNRIAVVPFISSRALELDGVKKGQIAQRLRLYIHFGIGAEEKRVVCPTTFGDPCPICKHRADLTAQGRDRDDPEVSALKYQKRDLYNIIDYSEEDKGIKLWDVSLGNFSDLLDTEAQDINEDYSIGHYAPEDGADLVVRMTEESFRGNKYFEAQRIDFIERQEPLEDEILEAAVSLDKELHIHSYKELEKMLFDVVVEGDEDEDEDDEPVRKSSKKASKSTSEDEDDDEEDEEDDFEEDEDEEDEEDEDDDEDEEDEDEEDEDDEPVRKSSKKASKSTKTKEAPKSSKQTKSSKKETKSSKSTKTKKRYDDDEEDD